MVNRMCLLVNSYTGWISYRTLLLIFVIGSGCDLVSSHAVFGWLPAAEQYEMNPVAVFFLVRYGWTGLAIAKGVVMCVVAGIAGYCRNKGHPEGKTILVIANVFVWTVVVYTWGAYLAPDRWFYYFSSRG